MTRRRRVVVAVAAAMVLLAISALWFGNTESLEFPFQDEPLQLAAGETAEVDTGGVCPPNTVITYRPSHFGRWQQTHVGGELKIRQWWAVSTQEFFSTLQCRIGPWLVSLPDDLVSDRLALCGLGAENCVEIIVERAD